VLHNGDLAEVSWEQREMEGDPRFPASQEVPAFPYAGYAELLGLRGIRVDDPDELPGAWAAALAADRPCVLEAVVDPDVPLLPPGRQEGAAEKMLDALAQEPGGDRAAEQVRAHLAQEPEPGG
jgi:pyruvate dehydrogenase (quinone)